jgi:tetratricopeptide (TPR) repeat protein/anti-sigma regulatory factor (Ser/Thr protein kinase)
MRENDGIMKYNFKILLLFVVAFFCKCSCNYLYAQKEGRPLIDSLEIELPKLKNDTNKVLVLNEMALNYSTINTDMGLQYGQQELELATKLNWKKGIGKATNIMGLNFFAKSNYLRALEYYRKALSIYEAIDFKQGRVIVLNNIGICYHQKGDNKTAIEYYFKGLKINQEINDKKWAAMIFANIGVMYEDNSDFPAALEFYFRALKIEEDNGYKNLAARTMGNIGNVFNYQEDYKKSLEYYFRSLKLAESMQDLYQCGWTNSRIGVVYANQNNYPLAVEYYNKSLAFYRQIGDKSEGMARVLGSLGNAYVKQKKYIDALETHLQSIEMEEEIGHKQGLAIALKYIGQLYISLAENNEERMQLIKNIAQKNRDIVYYIPADKKKCLGEALKYFDSSIAVSRQANLLVTIMECYKNIDGVYRLMGNNKKILEFSDKYRTLKDSIFSNENNKRLVMMDMKKEYDTKSLIDSLKGAEKERITKMELNRQHIYILFGGTGILIIAILLGVTYKNISRRKQLLFEKKVSETEMTALRAQMNPHFIFNALNSIHTYIKDNNNKLASSYLLRFSELTRIILENSLHQSVSLSEELHALELYLSLERVRLDEKMHYSIEVAANIDKNNILIPPLILQPFIENAILHGLEQKEKGGIIKIEFSKHENMLHCIITDNGIGRKKSGEAKKTTYAGKKESLGMRLTEQRIAIINKTKKANAYVSVTDIQNKDQSAGVKVELVLPLEEQF